MKSLAAFVVSLVLLPVCRAEGTLAPVISDHRIWQRRVGAAIWDTADPGEAVCLRLAGQLKTATADARGGWRVSLSSDIPFAEIDPK